MTSRAATNTQAARGLEGSSKHRGHPAGALLAKRYSLVRLNALQGKHEQHPSEETVEGPAANAPRIRDVSGRANPLLKATSSAMQARPPSDRVQPNLVVAMSAATVLVTTCLAPHESSPLSAMRTDHPPASRRPRSAIIPDVGPDNLAKGEEMQVILRIVLSDDVVRRDIREGELRSGNDPTLVVQVAVNQIRSRYTFARMGSQ